VVRNNLKRIENLESEQRALYAEGENFNKESRQLLNVSFGNIRVSCNFIHVFQCYVSLFDIFYCTMLVFLFSLNNYEKIENI